MIHRIIRIFLSLNLILLLSLFSVPAALAQESGSQIHITQVDKSNFPRVTVYVSVVDANGVPVGIDPATIQIQENDTVMELTDVRGGGNSPAMIPVTTMLVIDISGSMDKNGKLAAAKEAAKTYIAHMRPGDQAGLMTYDTKTYYVQPITTDTAALVSAIESLATGGDTAMYNALVEAEKNLETIQGRKSIIVLTDGLDNQSQSTVEEVIAGIGQSGLTISTVGFGDAASRGQVGLDEIRLKLLAEKTGGLYSFAGDAETLSKIYQQYGEVLQSEYALTYISPTSLRNGINRGLTVSLNGNAAATSSKYNPGGLIPEVTAQSWSMFIAILAVLLLLLALPFLANYGLNAYHSYRSASHKKGRVKFGEPMSTAPAKGRVKMK